MFLPIKRSSRFVIHRPSRYLILVAFALFTFWENFVLDIRIFDFVGLGILLVLAVFGRIKLKVSNPERMVAMLFAILNLCYAVFGVIRSYNSVYYDPSDIKASLGFGLGVSTFLLCRSVSLDQRQLLRTINVLMLTHSVCLLLQFLLFYVNDGFVLNLNPFFETEGLRVLTGAGFLRPSGFFAEPASHALTLTLLFSLKSRLISGARLDAIDWTGLFTMLISGSIWGIVACIVWAVYQKPIRGALILAAAFVILNSSYVIGFLSDIPMFNQVFLQRIDLLRFGEDKSLQARYTTSADFYQLDISDPFSIVGNGVQSGRGQNGIVRYLHSHGAVGFLSFLVLALFMAPKAERIRFLFWILFLLTAAGSLPFFFIWWSWLGFYSSLPARKSQVMAASPAPMNLSYA
jgi:hypothetical protein